MGWSQPGLRVSCQRMRRVCFQEIGECSLRIGVIGLLKIRKRLVIGLRRIGRALRRARCDRAAIIAGFSLIWPSVGVLVGWYAPFGSVTPPVTGAVAAGLFCSGAGLGGVAPMSAFIGAETGGVDVSVTAGADAPRSSSAFRRCSVSALYLSNWDCNWRIAKSRC